MRTTARAMGPLPGPFFSASNFWAVACFFFARIGFLNSFLFSLSKKRKKEKHLKTVFQKFRTARGDGVVCLLPPIWSATKGTRMYRMYVDEISAFLAGRKLVNAWPERILLHISLRSAEQPAALAGAHSTIGVLGMVLLLESFPSTVSGCNKTAFRNSGISAQAPPYRP
jgi:hypothetical protein